jgi:hypothetical protein
VRPQKKHARGVLSKYLILVARREGLELGERQPLMSGAVGRMVGGGVRSLAGSAETPRPKAASNAKKQARRFKVVVAVK